MSKTIEFKVRELAPVINFLTSLPLKNKVSRARTTLIRRLVAKQEEAQKGLDELNDEYLVKENDEFKVEDEQLVFKDKEKREEYKEQNKLLFEEKAVVDCTEILTSLKTLNEALEELDVELSDQDALVYDVVCEQLEKLNE